MKPGSDTRELAALALPATGAYLLANAFRVVDQYFVQFLPGAQGADAQGVIGNTTFVLIANHALFLMIGSGALSLVARARGAGDHERRDELLASAVGLALLFALLLGIAGWLGAGALVRLLGLSGESARLAEEYLRTIYLLLPGFALAPVLDQLFLALGRARAAFVLQLVTVVANVTLDRVLILGWGPIEARGLSGAAEAAAIARLIAAALGIAWLWRGEGLRGLRASAAFEVLATGLPQACATLAYAAVYFGVLRLVVNPLGREVQAGFAIGFTAVEGFTFPFSLGIAMAGASMIGKRLGAGEVEAAWRVVRRVRIAGALVGASVACAYWLFGERAAGWFSDEPAVRVETARYIGLIAFSQLFVALECVQERVLLGAGRTRTILWVSAPLNGLRVPLGWFCAVHLHLGAMGMWWVLNATSMAKAAAYAWVVQRGRWARSGLHHA